MVAGGGTAADGEVELWLPHQIDQAATFLATNGRRSAVCSITSEDPAAATIYLTLNVHRSRVLWNALRPLLLEAPPSVTQQALDCLFRSDGLFDWNAIERAMVAEATSLREGNFGFTDNKQHNNVYDDLLNDYGVQSRRLCHSLCPFQPKTNTKQNAIRLQKIVLWIQPPDSVSLQQDDLLFGSLLIRWEHRFIQAQSLAGYIATLGGGFFLCHHFKTAILLAEQQQRLAVLLNDETMYYACAVNKAYSCIYNGKFKTATSILRQVAAAIAPAAGDAADAGAGATSKNPTIDKMCRSALLFCKRMRRQSKVLLAMHGSGGGEKHNIGLSAQQQQQSNRNRNIDDFQRIRVVHDKSKKDDLVIPFSKASGI